MRVQVSRAPPGVGSGSAGGWCPERTTGERRKASLARDARAVSPFSSALKKRGKLDPSSPRRPRPASPDGRTARSDGWLALRAAVSGSRQQVNGPGRGVPGAWGRRGARYKGARPAAGATKQPARSALPICVPRPLPPRTPSPALGDQVGPGEWVRRRWLGQSGPAGTGGGKACRAGEVGALGTTNLHPTFVSMSGYAERNAAAPSPAHIGVGGPDPWPLSHRHLGRPQAPRARVGPLQG